MDFFKEEKNKGEYHNKFSFVFFLKVKKKIGRRFFLNKKAGRISHWSSAKKNLLLLLLCHCWTAGSFSFDAMSRAMVSLVCASVYIIRALAAAHPI